MWNRSGPIVKQIWDVSLQGLNLMFIIIVTQAQQIVLGAL